MGPGGKTIDYEPGKKYTLGCPEFGGITIKFPAGEQIKKWNNGASGEWMVEQTSMGLDLPIGVWGYVARRLQPPQNYRLQLTRRSTNSSWFPKLGG